MNFYTNAKYYFVVSWRLSTYKRWLLRRLTRTALLLQQPLMGTSFERNFEEEGTNKNPSVS